MKAGVTQRVCGNKVATVNLVLKHIPGPNPKSYLTAQPTLNPILDLSGCVPACMEDRIASASTHGGRAARVSGVDSHSSQALE